MREGGGESDHRNGVQELRSIPLPVPFSFGEEPTEFVLHAEFGRPPAEIGEVEQIALG